MILTRHKLIKSTRRAFIGGLITSAFAVPAIARRKLGQIGGGGTGESGGGLPAPPSGFAYIINADGSYLLNADGAYILAKVS